MSVTISAEGDQGGGNVASDTSGPTISITEDHALGADGDAAALAAAQRALTQSQADADAARRQAAAAQSEAARARNAAAQASRDRRSDHRAVLGQVIEGADAEINAAKVAKRTAREAGDVEAEIAADEQLQGALYRKVAAQGDLARLPAEPTSGAGDTEESAGGAGGNGQGNGAYAPTQRAQQWFHAHPRFNSDDSYKQRAIDIHNWMAGQGLTESTDPDRYYNTLDHNLRLAFGDNHGGASSGGYSMQNQGGGGNGRDTGGAAAPPNRGGGGNPGGGQVIDLIDGLGRVRVRERSGNMDIQFMDKDTTENMHEGAKICYPSEYQKNPQNAVGLYTRDQVSIAREQARGGNVVRSGERVFK